MYYILKQGPVSKPVNPNQSEHIYGIFNNSTDAISAAQAIILHELKTIQQNLDNDHYSGLMITEIRKLNQITQSISEFRIGYHLDTMQPYVITDAN